MDSNTLIDPDISITTPHWYVVSPNSSVARTNQKPLVRDTKNMLDVINIERTINGLGASRKTLKVPLKDSNAFPGTVFRGIWSWSGFSARWLVWIRVSGCLTKLRGVCFCFCIWLLRVCHPMMASLTRILPGAMAPCDGQPRPMKVDMCM